MNSCARLWNSLNPGVFQVHFRRFTESDQSRVSFVILAPLPCRCHIPRVHSLSALLVRMQRLFLLEGQTNPRLFAPFPQTFWHSLYSLRQAGGGRKSVGHYQRDVGMLTGRYKLVQNALDIVCGRSCRVDLLPVGDAQVFFQAPGCHVDLKTRGSTQLCNAGVLC